MTPEDQERLAHLERYLFDESFGDSRARQLDKLLKSINPETVSDISTIVKAYNAGKMGGRIIIWLAGLIAAIGVIVAAAKGYGWGDRP